MRKVREQQLAKLAAEEPELFDKKAQEIVGNFDFKELEKNKKKLLLLRIHVCCSRCVTLSHTRPRKQSV